MNKHLDNWEKERVFIHPLIGARNQKVTITNCGSGYTLPTLSPIHNTIYRDYFTSK
jgi:hypothetical protein